MPKPAHCTACDRHFSDKYALDAHNNAKHPPTYHCHTCARAFREEAYLHEHFRGSPFHPNCSICGKGFKTDVLCAAHVEEKHPKMDCALRECRVTDVYEHQLREHYALSGAHPTCKVLNCGKGFFDAAELGVHLESSHAEQTCVTCRTIFESVDALEEHWRVSPLHTVCVRCDKGFPTLEAHMEHSMSIHSPEPEPAPKNVFWDTDDVASVHSDMTVKTTSPFLESKHAACKTHLKEKGKGKEKCTEEPKASPTWACQFTFQNSLLQDTDTDSTIDHAAWVEGLVSDTPPVASASASATLSLLPPRPRVHRPSFSTSSSQSPFNVQSTSSRNSGPRMHCRLCTRDPCANASATLCGHVFCRSCIMNAVVISAKCPVCRQRLTVDCVFGLDLAY